jgi:hypothetical protein
VIPPAAGLRASAHQPGRTAIAVRIHTADAVWAEGVRRHLAVGDTVHVVVAARPTPWVREVLAQHAAEPVVGDLTEREVAELGRGEPPPGP